MNIELSRLTKNYGGVHALDDISFTITPGSLVAVIGLNGAGKTTLLRCLAGIVSPSRGRVVYDGETFHRGRLDLRRRFMFLPDFPPLYANQTVLEHVSMLAKLYEFDATGATARLMECLGNLDLLPLAETPIGQLSRGQVYKAALSALFTLAPELWLLDEPFASGLDPQGLAVLKQEARAHTAHGGTILYSTQILEIAGSFCDQLAVIDSGRLVSVYTRAELEAMPPAGPDSLESRLRQFRSPLTG